MLPKVKQAIADHSDAIDHDSDAIDHDQILDFRFYSSFHLFEPHLRGTAVLCPQSVVYLREDAVNNRINNSLI